MAFKELEEQIRALQLKVVAAAAPPVIPEIPAGVIQAYAGVTAPDDWGLCHGQEFSRTANAALFAALGTRYGVGNGSSTFNIPDLRGRAPVGMDIAQTEFETLGKTGGAKTHKLTTAEMPSHTHPYTNSDNSTTAQFSVAGGTGMDNKTNRPGTTSATGGNGAHNNLAPYLTINYIIKL